MVPNDNVLSSLSRRSLVSVAVLCLISTLSVDVGRRVGSRTDGGGSSGSGGSFFLFAGASFSPKDYLKREHSLVKPYHGSAWDYGGSTMVTSNYVRLTADKPSQAGFIWNRVPCHLR